MKRIVLLILAAALSVPPTVLAQDGKKPSWRKTEDQWARKNSITGTISLFGATNYTGCGIGQIGVEYDRVLPFNLSVSVTGQCAPCPMPTSKDSYSLNEIFYFAGVKLNYNLPVVKNILYLRIGAGGGVGYHQVIHRVMGMCWNSGCGESEPSVEPKPKPPLKDVVRGHFMFDLHWIVRVNRKVELKFAPLIISPSQIIFGSKFNEPYNDTNYIYFNAFGTLGVGVRF